MHFQLVFIAALVKNPVFEPTVMRSNLFLRCKQQRGFTLVEMGVVLAIIGFILTGILGGQSLIRSAKVNDVMAIVEDLRTAATLFKQRFNYLPGDFPAAAGDIAGIPSPAPAIAETGNGNGQVGAAGNVGAGTGVAVAGTEVAWAPLHLFNAGLLGKVNSQEPLRLIKTSYGGVHLVSNLIATALVPANAPAPGFAAQNPTARNAIVFFNLPCDVAREVDLKIDDGDGLKGRAVGNFTATGACPANDIIDWYAVAL
jgi:prepilin-type N-terminal cleavage/methylation domain-containing protein